MQFHLISITIACICCLSAVARSIVVSVADETPVEEAVSSQDPEPQAEGNGAGAFIGLQPNEMSQWVEEQESRGDDEPLAEPASLGSDSGTPPRHVDDIDDLRTAEFISAIIFALEHDTNWRAPQPSEHGLKQDDEVEV
ncbi:hypothetical protein IW140_004821 [Coemansia sp. RSA 1813]|nr:hypothetical protein EV178_004848 [Coemansia sp. RSA 1646]KAJ1766984.1 hypothetical protein LPJ74_005611 [Coemansia sp. RSA 1843]KAJ2088819.1 hypothetical protein IW138_003891 [Coemansia sp. RSA 986]KAJ2212351.1 hypothetical protein EV179_004746 [Coemansia sp. RSA 487]KAJ2566698.1 hypothetical protein IW140_004821 [Coemansia sp. RSA 1813]